MADCTTETSAGVSVWLFVGQLAASVGFTIYSVLLRNWVFAAALAGVVYLLFTRMLAVVLPAGLLG